MEQESVEDLILNGDVPTPIKPGDIGRSGAKLLGMLSETDNSGIEYKSFTEESATEDEYVTPVELNGHDDETKAPFKSKIVLPRISSPRVLEVLQTMATTFIAMKLMQEAKRIESNERDQGLRRKRKKFVEIPKRQKGPGGGARVRIKLIRKERRRRERRTRRNDTGPSRD